MRNDEELRIGPYFNPPVACHDYDPCAPEVAQRVALMITHRLPTLTVEHVGSSSVPGCAGKGVIDLMLLYPSGQLEEAKGVLAELGFQRQTSRNPFPEKRPMRTGSLQYQGKTYRLHVHVLVADSQESTQMRAFRDRLRADPHLLAAYVARKREIIASGASDSLEYARVKGSFVQDMLSE
jgi:GrpB-like predicted nucleotidyltransferase (UPF0157 family)